MYKIGDTVAVFNPPQLTYQSNALADVLESMATSTLPEWARENYTYVTLTTQEQVDEFNNNRLS